MKKYKKFFEEDIWREAYELQKEVFEISRSFPPEERYGLWNQINKSSNSVVANRAEAHGRYYFADKVRTLYIVRCELEETQSHLIVACSRGYVSKEACLKLVNKYENLKKKINGDIKNLNSQKK
ncbi:MAG: four helix bundle protein [Candidatus Magasanikbacteria bacterium]|nr:four helix bundle protein [Candidatus Magasanikbacteria bacterium]